MSFYNSFALARGIFHGTSSELKNNKKQARGAVIRLISQSYKKKLTRMDKERFIELCRDVFKSR